MSPRPSPATIASSRGDDPLEPVLLRKNGRHRRNPPAEERREARRLGRLRRRNTEQIERRRKERHRAHRRGDTPTCWHAPRIAYYEGHVDEPLRERHFVPVKPVLAEKLTVIRDDHQHRVIERAALAQRIEHKRDEPVFIADARII